MENQTDNKKTKKAQFRSDQCPICGSIEIGQHAQDCGNKMSLEDIWTIQNRFLKLWELTKTGVATPDELAELSKLQYDYWDRPEVIVRLPEFGR